MSFEDKPVSRQRRWQIRTRDNLRNYFGDRCNNPICQNTNQLEFAHISATGLNGKGRGSDARIRDILKNTDSFMLLCNECHMKFDRGEL